VQRAVARPPPCCQGTLTNQPVTPRHHPQLIMPAALSLALKMRESPKPVTHIIAEFERRRWREYERARPGEPRRSHDKVRRRVGVGRHSSHLAAVGADKVALN
jgi:hypothetical protein